MAEEEKSSEALLLHMLKVTGSVFSCETYCQQKNAEGNEMTIEECYRIFVEPNSDAARDWLTEFVSTSPQRALCEDGIERELWVCDVDYLEMIAEKAKRVRKYKPEDGPFFFEVWVQTSLDATIARFFEREVKGRKRAKKKKSLWQIQASGDVFRGSTLAQKH